MRASQREARLSFVGQVPGKFQVKSTLAEKSSYKNRHHWCLFIEMNRKLIFAGVGALIVLAIIVLIAGQHGWNKSTKSEHSEFVLSSDGKLTLKPGDETKMTVVVDQRRASATNSRPATATPP